MKSFLILLKSRNYVKREKPKVSMIDDVFYLFPYSLTLTGSTTFQGIEMPEYDIKYGIKHAIRHSLKVVTAC